MKCRGRLMTNFVGGLVAVACLMLVPTALVVASAYPEERSRSKNFVIPEPTYEILVECSGETWSSCTIVDVQVTSIEL